MPAVRYPSCIACFGRLARAGQARAGTAGQRLLNPPLTTVVSPTAPTPSSRGPTSPTPLWYVTKHAWDGFRVQNGKPGYRPGQRHVQPPQAECLARGDRARTDQDDMIALKAFSQRNRNDCQ